jgi:peptidoglycan hydrolase-like protein with peptidoglycan-binding domain
VVGPFSVTINNGDAETQSREVMLTLEAGGETAWAKIDNHWRFGNAQWVVFNESYAARSWTPVYLTLIVIAFGSLGFWFSGSKRLRMHLVAVGLILISGILLSRSTVLGGSPTITVPWTLSDGEGEKTVYVQFYTRNKEGGNSSPMVSDTIMYRTGLPTESVEPGVGGFNPEASESPESTPTPPSLPARIGERDPSCAPLLTKLLAYGYSNDREQVSRLQTFLREVFGARGLPTTGVFDRTTESIVKSFQQQYAVDILRPWPIRTPTGIVAFYTRRAVNYLWCVAQ